MFSYTRVDIFNLKTRFGKEFMQIIPVKNSFLFLPQQLNFYVDRATGTHALTHKFC